MTQQPAPPAAPIEAQPAQPAIAAPGTAQPVFLPPPALPQLPNEYVLLSTLLILVTLLPLSVALARRLWRGSQNSAASTNLRLDDRLANMQDAIDSMALEVERIGEGQRYVTNLLSGSAKGTPLDSLKKLPESVPKQDFRSITPH